MGARLYDPVTAGFLSPDPMEPVAGAGYMGASYLFASGDPVNLHDPTGLQPIPAEAMRKYTEYIESDDFIRDFDRAMAEETKRHWDGFWSVDGWKKSLEELQKDPGRWFNDHGKDVLAGVVFVGGLLLMIPQATRGVGGTIVTSMLFSAVLQKWEYGDLNPDQLTLDGLLGGITAAAVVLYLQRLERLQSMSGMTLRLEATQLSINAPRWGSKAPKKFSIQDFFAGGFFKSQEAAPLTGLYRDGAEGARTVNELRRLRYPKVEIEVKPVAGGARSATEVPPVAVSRVDVPQVAPVEGSGASRGASQVPVKPVEAPQVGEVPPASGAGSGAAGMQAVKPGGVADDAVAARGSAGVREPEVQLKPVEEAKVEGLPPTAKGKDTEVPKDLESPQPTPSKNVTPNQGWQTEAIERGIHPSLVQGEQVARDALGIERDGLSHVQYDKVNNVYYENPQQVTNALGKWEKNKDVHGTVIRGPENPYPRLRIFDDTLAPADYTTAPMGGPKTKLNYSITPAEKFTGRIPQEATDLARYTWSEEIPDRGIRVFKNKDLKTKEKILPDKTINGDNIRYFEIDVRDAGYIMRDEPRLPVKRDNERLVVGSNGDIYYTPNHYKDFVLLRRS